MPEQPVRAQIDRGGHQVVEVTVRGGYWPPVIRAHVGIPLRLVFRREDTDACTERIVFSTPRLERRLSPCGSTTIDLPAQPAGEIRFTCGMGRYRGRIELVDDPVPSAPSRFRPWTSRLEATRGTTLLTSIGAVAALAVLVVTTDDARSAAIAAGALFIVSIAAFVREVRRSTHATTGR